MSNQSRASRVTQDSENISYEFFIAYFERKLKELNENMEILVDERDISESRKVQAKCQVEINKLEKEHYKICTELEKFKKFAEKKKLQNEERLAREKSIVCAKLKYFSLFLFMFTLFVLAFFTFSNFQNHQPIDDFEPIEESFLHIAGYERDGSKSHDKVAYMVNPKHSYRTYPELSIESFFNLAEFQGYKVKSHDNVPYSRIIDLRYSNLASEPEF